MAAPLSCAFLPQPYPLWCLPVCRVFVSCRLCLFGYVIRLHIYVAPHYTIFPFPGFPKCLGLSTHQHLEFVLLCEPHSKEPLLYPPLRSISWGTKRIEHASVVQVLVSPWWLDNTREESYLVNPWGGVALTSLLVHWTTWRICENNSATTRAATSREKPKGRHHHQQQQQQRRER